MDRRPIILITAEDINDATGNVYVMNKEYGRAIRAAGGQPCAAGSFDEAEDYAEFADGLVIAHGPVIHPFRYGGRIEKPEDLMGNSQTKDDFDFAILKAFLKAEKPVLGINRGALVINAALGGTIAKAIPPHILEEGEYTEKLFGLPITLKGIWSTYNHSYGPQKMIIEAGSRLSRYLGTECTANTFHEQAIGQLAEGLKVMARAEDGIIEAFEHESLPVIGIQWNPEHGCEGYDPDPAVYRMFVDMVKEGK